MPRYFFSTIDGSGQPDTEGVDLPDDATARKEGIRFAGSVLANEPDVLENGRDFRVEVTNDRRDLLCTIVTLALDAPAARPAR